MKEGEEELVKTLYAMKVNGSFLEMQKQKKQQQQGNERRTPSSPLDAVYDDILIEFFLALPNHQLVARCKLVSKKWYCLISNTNFISRFVTRKIHQNSFSEHQYASIILSYENLRDRTSLFISSNSTDPYFCSTGFQLTFLPETVSVLGSFIDLLCCATATNKKNVFKSFYICNPFTLDWVTLPSPPKKDYYGRTYTGFICEPYYYRVRATTTQALDHYAINDGYRYRVVRFTEVAEYIVKVSTYCSETAVWDEYDLTGPGYAFCSNFVAHHGKLLWFNGANLVAYDPFHGGQICFVDGSELTLPKPINTGHFHSYCLAVCQGRLRLMLLVAPMAKGATDSNNTLRIWEHDTRKWKLEHKICLTAMVSNNSWVQKYVKGGMVGAQALAFNPTNKDTVYLGQFERVMSCNLSTGELNIAGGIPRGSDFHGCKYAFPILLPWWPTPVPHNAHL